MVCAVLPATIANAQNRLLDSSAAGAARVLFYQDGQESYVETAGKLRAGGRAVQADDLFLTASVGKLYTATAILQLHDQGLLDIDAPVSRYVSDAISEGFGGLDDVTVAMLLTMTSGLPDYLDDDFVADDVAGTVTAEDALFHAMKHRRNFAAGSAFDYSNTNYVLAQVVIETLTGQPLDAVLRRGIFGPAGDDAAYVVGTRAAPAHLAIGPEGAALDQYYADPGFGDGAIVTTAKGIAAFYRALLGTQSLLSPDSLTRLLDDPLAEGYGMGIEVERDPDLGVVYGHSGGDLGYAADVRYRADTGAIAVLLAADEDADIDITYDALISGCETC